MVKSKLNSGAAKLRMWLVKNNVLQGKMAEEAGVSRSTIVALCAGVGVPTLDAAKRIEKSTNGTVQPGDWLAPYTGAMSRVPTFRRGRRTNASLLAEAVK